METAMKKMMIAAGVAAMALAGCVSGPKVDNAPVATLDLDRYLGEWYEIARFDHSSSAAWSRRRPTIRRTRTVRSRS